MAGGTSETERTLGRFVRNHPVDNRRRGRVALVALLFGVALSGAGIPLLISEFGAGGQYRVSGIVMGLGLVGLGLGTVGGLRALRRDEVYQLREGGLVYKRPGRTRLVRWEDIRKVRDGGQDRLLSRWAGWDVHCVLRVRGGRGLLITGFTEDAGRLAYLVERAVHNGQRPPPSARHP